MLILNVAVRVHLFWWPPCSIGLCGASGSFGFICLGIGLWRSELVEVNKYIGREGALRKKVRRCRCAAVDFDLLLSLCGSVPSLRTVFYIFTILNILIIVSICISRSSGRLPPSRLFNLRLRLLVTRHRLSASPVFVVHRLA